MKKYIVVDQTVEEAAEARGLDVDAFTGPPDEGPDPADSSHIASEPVKFDPNTTVWSVPSGDGFLCEQYAGETNPMNSALPITVESLDEFANE